MVCTGAGVLLYPFASAPAQGHSPWLSVGVEPTDRTGLGQVRVLVLHDRGWHWLDPDSAWDRAENVWLLDVGQSDQTVPTEQALLEGNDRSAPNIQEGASGADWLRAGIVGASMVLGFGGLYWFVNRSNGLTSARSDAPSNDPNDDGGGTASSSVVLNSPITVNENHEGWLTTARAEGFGTNQIQYNLSGPDNEFFIIDRETGTIETRPGVVLDYDQAMDHDADNHFEVIILVEDQSGDAAQSPLVISVIDVDDEAPIITPTMFELDWLEGQVGEIGRFEVSDADTAREAISFVLSGADGAIFVTDQNGILRLEQALDFENPVDENGDGVFDLALRAQDTAGNISDAVTIEVRLSNQWEPIVASTVSFASTLQVAQSSLTFAVANEIDHASVFTSLDFDADGDSDGLFVSTDIDGLNGAPSLVIAAFDDPNLGSFDQLLWSYGAEVPELSQIGDIGSMSAALVAGTTNDFQFSMLGDDGQLDVSVIPLFGGRAVGFSSPDVADPYRLYSDEDDDSVYDHFWEFTPEGVFRGGSNEGQQAAVLLASDLKKTPDLLFAVGDVNADQHHDILTLSTVTGGIDTWLMDEDRGQLIKAATAENPYAFFLFPEGFPDLDSIRQFGFASSPSDANVGAIPDLIFTGADVLWVLEG